MFVYHHSIRSLYSSWTLIFLTVSYPKMTARLYMEELVILAVSPFVKIAHLSVFHRQTPRMNTVCGLYPQVILTDNQICQAIFNFGRGNFPSCRGTWRETSKSNKSQTIEQSYFLISPSSIQGCYCTVYTGVLLSECPFLSWYWHMNLFNFYLHRSSISAPAIIFKLKKIL